MLIPLAQADGRCGAKAVGLARLMRAGFAVPPGFVVPDVRPAGWTSDIEPALDRLGAGPFAVRSSAPGEDGRETSFAGQHRTVLGVVTHAGVVREVVRVAGSAREPAAVAYAARSGRTPAAVIPVVVQVQVPARVAGVLFTRHPVTGAHQVVVEAAAGLGEQVVGGTTTPQAWTVDDDGTTSAPAVGQPVLTPAEVRELVAIGRRVEAAAGCAQDVEWAIAGDTVWVLQARPVTALPTGRARAGAPQGDVLATGTPGSPGRASGVARVVRGLDELHRFGAGEVLVCRTTTPAWTPLLARAAAVVTETGGVLAHAAIVAREFGIPAVLAADGATAALPDGAHVVVDGTDGTVALTADRGGLR